MSFPAQNLANRDRPLSYVLKLELCNKDLNFLKYYSKPPR